MAGLTVRNALAKKVARHVSEQRIRQRKVDSGRAVNASTQDQEMVAHFDSLVLNLLPFFKISVDKCATGLRSIALTAELNNSTF